MEHKMKRKVIVAIIIILIMCLESCDKTDVNGDLDGNWQLIEWKDNATQSIVATNMSRRIYYTIKYNILQTKDIDASYDTFHLSYFHYTNDSLFIDKTFRRPFDTEEPLDSLVKYGCPADGKFAITTLTGNKLVLSCPNSRLTFRKY